MSVAEAPAPVGHNKPPEQSPYEAIKAHADDLLVEARNWADGAAVESQAQADEISRLIGDLRKAEKAANDARVEEVRPLDEQRDAIQDRYNVYVAPLKNKKPGKLPLAMDALKKVLDPWLTKLDDEKKAVAAEAQRKADEAAKIAAEAMRAAPPMDLAAREEAEGLVQVAALAEADAKRAANDKAHARGGDRAIGLRSYWIAEIENPRDALLHYWTTNREPLITALQTLAQQDVTAGKRQIPGVIAREDKRVA